jgi:hypothetical protein
MRSLLKKLCYVKKVWFGADFTSARWWEQFFLALQHWLKVTHGPAHFLRARSARHLQYMNGRHTRNKRVVKHVSNAVMTRKCHAGVVRMSYECCANVARMLYRWGALHARHSSSKCDVKRASYARHSSSKCDVKRAGCAHYTRREKRAS